MRTARWSPIAEMRRYLETGIDGLFSDDPALARAAMKA
jgi:glycerophosphoryl diester phosphodiesterase